MQQHSFRGPASRDAIENVLVGLDTLSLRFGGHVLAQQPKLADEQIVPQRFAHEFFGRLSRLAYCFVQGSLQVVGKGDGYGGSHS